MMKPAAPTARDDALDARGLGVTMLVLALPAGLVTFVFVMASQTGFRDERGWSTQAALFSALVTLWLVLASIALLGRRSGASLRVPGCVALVAGLLGLATFLPSALFGNGRASETVTLSRIFLPLTLTLFAAGVGHLLRARGPAIEAKVLHAIAPVGVVLAFGVLGLAVMRVL